jgi:hypothetical protein
MLVLLSLVLTHFIRKRFKRQTDSDALNAVPALIAPKRFPLFRRRSLPENIPTANF